MQNYGEDQFFSTTIEVGEAPKTAPEYSRDPESPITFHPEGGRLLAGITNRLVVRATLQDADGLNGHIVDEAGRPPFLPPAKCLPAATAAATG